MDSNKDILWFSTIGSVDDGKSTLIGRLLYDTNCVYIDQFEAVSEASKKKGLNRTDFALITDGLKSEREQGITIDVAYRYFATDKRKFVVADSPGHVQYTRNAITGSSHCDVAIILIDAKNGITEQSKRHAFISSLLRINHLLIAVNKMDLVDYSEDKYNQIVDEFSSFLGKLDVGDISFCPISALEGDNVLMPSYNMTWYQGSTVLDYLENVYVRPVSNTVDFRFSVQMPMRPDANFRGYAGEVISGSVKVGDEVIIFPSKQKTKIKAIYKKNESLSSVDGGIAVLSFDDEIDVERGDTVARVNNQPTFGNVFESILCWMSDTPMEMRKTYILKHNSYVTNVRINNMRYVIDVNTTHKEEPHPLNANEIGRASMETFDSFAYDCYQINKGTGSFILIDPDSCDTVAAGFIKFENKNKDDKKIDVITTEDREIRNGHRGRVIWFTGFSGAGKTTIAKDVELRLFSQGKQIILLDGDLVREGLCGDLGFSKEDRDENIRRMGEIAKMLCDHGMIVLCTFISPFREQREFVKNLVGDKFFEVYVHCPIEVCEKRDVKGLYKKFRNNEIELMTGFTSPYEIPLNPDMVLYTDESSLEECVEEIIKIL